MSLVWRMMVSVWARRSFKLFCSLMKLSLLLVRHITRKTISRPMPATASTIIAFSFLSDW